MNWLKQWSVATGLVRTVALCLMWASPAATAQTYTVLKHFSGSDGANPRADLILSGDALYGTTYFGGSSNVGTVFRVNTDGTGYAVLKHFTVSDGANPYGGVTLSGSTLYGTTRNGGSSNLGTVFQVDTDGTGYAVLKHFTGSEGAIPRAGLTLSGSTLFGTTEYGGNSNCGTIFQLNTDGTGHAILKHFSFPDGAGPQAGLLASGTVLYGTTYYGGSANVGTVFKVNTDGTGYIVLKHFNYDATDGSFPSAGLVLANGVLFGTTTENGSARGGTLFKVNTDGTGYAILKHFRKPSGGVPFLNDGSRPEGGLILSGGWLYGTTAEGGLWGRGTVFQVNMEGTEYRVLKDFTSTISTSDGANPFAALVLSNGTLYGTTTYEGNSNAGTVFKIELPAPLDAQLQGDSIVLKWNGSGFVLQSAGEVTGTYTNIPGAVSPFTNVNSGTRMFFRLTGN